MIKSFILLAILFCVDAKFIPRSHEINSKVITDVAFELFTRQNIDFDFVVLGTCSYRFKKTIDEVIKGHRHRIRTFHLNDLLDWDGLNGVIFIEEEAQVIKFFENNPYGAFSKAERPKTLFYMPRFNQLKKYAWTHKYFMSFFLIESKKGFDLMIYTPWTKEKCNLEQVLTLNSYDKKNQKWERPLELSNDFRKTYGCPVKVFSGIYKLPTFDMMKDAGLTYLNPVIQPILERRDAKEREILSILTKIANFTPVELSSRFDYSSWLTSVTNSYNGYESSCSIGVFQYTILILYSPPEPFTNYEKMLLPFDHTTWIYLALVICLALVGIFIMNRMQSVRRLMYGNERSMSYFNVVGTLFGVGRALVPRTNFGKIVLITFIFFCLTLRAAYQGVFFEMFTTEMLRSCPKTFLDLKDRNYTLYTTETPHIKLSFIENAINEKDRPRLQKLGMTETNAIFAKLNDPSLKAALFTTEADLKTFRAGYVSRKILNERIDFAPEGICTWSRYFLSDLSVNVSNKLITAGIIQYWYSYLLDYEIKPVEEPQKAPKVFSIEDLKFGFIIWLIACGVSAAGFIVEWIYFIGKRVMIRSVQFWIEIYSIMNFINSKVFT